MLNDVMRKLFPEEMECRDQGKCPFCGKEINPENDFRDDLSRKEYTISGMCQDCQDDFFQ